MLLTTITRLLIIMFLGFGYTISAIAQELSAVEHARLAQSQWNGKKVAFLGDSITDKKRIGTNYLYWEHLRDLLHITPFVYGQSGHTWKEILHQAETLIHEDIDSLAAIFIFAGTNDYNANVPIGNLYTEQLALVNHNGNHVKRKMRTINNDTETYYGRINTALNYIKANFPTTPIFILTPLHRGFAMFGARNVQPDERYANEQGAYIDAYVAAIRDVAMHWSVPIIDLYANSGMQPLVASNALFFANQEKDLLHPSSLGHWHMAKFIAYQMLCYPLYY